MLCVYEYVKEYARLFGRLISCLCSASYTPLAARIRHLSLFGWRNRWSSISMIFNPLSLALETAKIRDGNDVVNLHNLTYLQNLPQDVIIDFYVRGY